MKVIDEHLCVSHIFSGKSLLRGGVDIFSRVFQTGQHVPAYEREIAESEIPFAMSPNSFTTS